MNENKSIAVIGAGPAGIAAAIQLRRHGFNPFLLEKEQPGGLLRQARWVENYPGFPGGISGIDLADVFWKQAAAFGVEWLKAEVLALEPGRASMVLHTTTGSLAAAGLVLASGSRPRPLPARYRDHRLAGLVFNDLNLVQTGPGRLVAVLGGGDAAFDYALNLAGRGCRVFILLRDGKEKCLPLLAESCREHPGIELFYRTEPKQARLTPDHRLGLLIGPGTRELQVDCLLAAIGRRAEDRLWRGLDRENRRFLLSTRRIVLAGDVKNGRLRQTALAVGDGVRAAMMLARRIERGNRK